MLQQNIFRPLMKKLPHLVRRMLNLKLLLFLFLKTQLDELNTLHGIQYPIIYVMLFYTFNYFKINFTYSVPISKKIF